MLNYYETLTDDSGNALVGATITVTAYPGGGATPIYQTNSTAIPIAGSKAASDVTGQVSFFIPDGVYILTYTYNGTVWKTKSPVQMVDPTSFVSLPETGSVNAYVVNDSRISATLYVGMRVTFLATHSNSAAATLNVNGTGAQPINFPGSAALAAGYIANGGITQVEWDGTQWQLLNSPVNLTASVVGSLLYPQTTGEAAQGVVPTNSWYPPYHPFRYMSTAQINDVKGKTATLDVTTPLQNAIKCAWADGGGTVNLPEGIFLCGKLFLYPFASIIGQGMDICELRRNPTDTTGTWISVVGGGIVTNGGQFQGFQISGFLMNGNFVGTNLGGMDLLNINGGSKNFSIGTCFVLRDIEAYHCTGIGWQIGFNAGTIFNIWALGCLQGMYFQGLVGYAYFISSAGSTNEEIIIDCDGFEAFGVETEWVGTGTNNAAKNVINIINQGKVALYGVSNTGGTLVRNAIVGTNGNPYVSVQNLVKRSANPTHSIDDNGTFYDDAVINYWANGPIVAGLVDQLRAPSLTFPATQTPSSNLNALDDYREYTAPSTACTGALTNSIAYKVVKVGRQVSLTIPGFIGTALAQPSVSLGAVLPAIFWPVNPVYANCAQVVDNAAYQANAGLVTVDATGHIVIYKNGTTTANFTAAANTGFPADTCITWQAAS